MTERKKGIITNIGYAVFFGVLGTIALTFKHMRQNPRLSFIEAIVDGKWWLLGLWLVMAIIFTINVRERDNE
jgi:hypothetical protein